ncbi:MAG: hypothetical protein KGN35_10420, partial [Betaproteobacteria bacterium]|nr:hypothetical protein [Betaproteobacteria bacterium]
MFGISVPSDVDEETKALAVPRVKSLGGNPASIYDPLTGKDASLFSRKPWAEFVALTKSGKNIRDGAVIHVYDVHSAMGAGGVFFAWDALACKFGQIGGPIVYDYLTGAPPAGTFPGLRVWIRNNCGLGGAEMIDNGTRYVHARRGKILMACLPTRFTISSNKTDWTLGAQWAIPPGFLAIGDCISAESDTSKSGTANKLGRDFFIGTSGVMGASPGDASLLWIGKAPGVNDFRFSGAGASIGCDEIKKWVIESATSI